MLITFKVKESMEEIIYSVYNGVFYKSIHQNEKSPGGWDIVLLEDRDYPCSATAWVNPNEDTIEIDTCWSQFQYTIWEQNGQVLVRYKGAFNGLLAQNLLPKLSPIDLENEVVTTSLKEGRLTYREYKQIQEKFKNFKASI